MVYIVGSSSVLEKEVLLEKKAKEAFSFLNQQTSPFIRSVSLVFTDRKTYTLHTQPLRALDKTHSNCLFSKDVVDLAFEAFVDDRVLKEEGENSAKARAWSAGEKLVAEGCLR